MSEFSINTEVPETYVLGGYTTFDTTPSGVSDGVGGTAGVDEWSDGSRHTYDIESGAPIVADGVYVRYNSSDSSLSLDVEIQTPSDFYDVIQGASEGSTGGGFVTEGTFEMAEVEAVAIDPSAHNIDIVEIKLHTPTVGPHGHSA
ncbi:hypothetical protein C2R22_10750 [Salinigranum rubrum]|uniref:Uncharacterized protein n=1 Tax=Salinigranum rubrum TaxID=755307 RepID=A0A2I8VJG9_9EURY|nr:hypothetical protein [Salinigranum rubrum]AUV82068.1 hypothetical protein C2R22_10750 [Salinigranum rubrum]